jgi:hypothetical protein
MHLPRRTRAWRSLGVHVMNVDSRYNWEQVMVSLDALQVRIQQTIREIDTEIYVPWYEMTKYDGKDMDMMPETINNHDDVLDFLNETIKELTNVANKLRNM